MALSITINQTQYRNDSSVMPRINIGGYTGIPFIKLNTWQYFKAGYNTLILEPNNRSLPVCPVSLRNCFHDGVSWTKDASGGGFSIVPFSPNGFYRNGGTSTGSWKGAYYPTPLGGDMISIQAQARSTELPAGISLQDAPFSTHIYDADTVAHSLTFGSNGKLAIKEKGVQPKAQTTNFRYEVGDVGMIEYDRIRQIVRYYLIRKRQMILLRTTRPKFTTTNIIAEMMLFMPQSSLEEIFVCNGDEAVATFENIAVARQSKGEYGWQAWRNPRSRTSTADPIQLADGEQHFTYPTSKTVLRQNSLTPKAFSKTAFQYFEDFFNYHGNEREFIFVDEARKDASGNQQEFWARFNGAMSDESSNGCIFDNTVQVIEAYRGDYVPRQIDTTAPQVYTEENSGTSGFARYVVDTIDNVGCKLARIFVDGNQIGEDVYADGTEQFIFEFDLGQLAPGDHTVIAKAYDFAGNEGVAPPRTLSV